MKRQHALGTIVFGLMGILPTFAKPENEGQQQDMRAKAQTLGNNIRNSGESHINYITENHDFADVSYVHSIVIDKITYFTIATYRNNQSNNAGELQRIQIFCIERFPQVWCMDGTPCDYQESLIDYNADGTCDAGVRNSEDRRTFESSYFNTDCRHPCNVCEQNRQQFQRKYEQTLDLLLESYSKSHK